MVSILDLAPAKKTVTLAKGKTADVRGLSAVDIASLLRKYPEFRSMLGGRGASLNPADLIDKFPVAMAHVIVIGLDGTVTDDEIVAAGKLPVAYQLALLMGIIEETLGGDIDGPFVQKVLALASSVDTGAGGKAPATKSSRASKS
jgi:hypothetical protein